MNGLPDKIKTNAGIAIMLLGIAFSAGGTYTLTTIMAQKEIVEQAEFEKLEQKVIKRREFEAVVGGMKGDISEIKGDVKGIEQLIRKHYSVGDDH